MFDYIFGLYFRMRQAKRVFDEGHALLRRNSATGSYLSSNSRTSLNQFSKTASSRERGSAGASSRVDVSSSCLFSSSSIAKLLNNLQTDFAESNNSNSNGNQKNGENRSKKGRSSRNKTTRSTSSSSMGSRQPQRRSSSGSGLSTTSSGSGMSNGLQRFPTGNSGLSGTGNDLMGRASSASSLSSFDDRYDHLYSYSSNLDLFEHQLYKNASKKERGGGKAGHGKPSNKTEAVNDFDLTAETRLLMDRTNQLVGKKSDREWVI